MINDSFWKIPERESKYIWLFISRRTQRRLKIVSDLGRDRPETGQIFKSEQYMKNQAMPVNIQGQRVYNTEKGERQKCWGREINKRQRERGLTAVSYNTGPQPLGSNA